MTVTVPLPLLVAFWVLYAVAVAAFLVEAARFLSRSRRYRSRR